LNNNEFNGQLYLSTRAICKLEDSMSEDIRRSRHFRDMEHLFVPEYDAANMPSANKRAAYALEHIAFRMGRIEEKLDLLVGALAGLVERNFGRHS
jgi:hypothetical protein